MSDTYSFVYCLAAYLEFSCDACFLESSAFVFPDLQLFWGQVADA